MPRKLAGLPQLPATSEERQMVEHVRARIAYLAQHKVTAFGVDASWLDESDSWAASLECMKHVAMGHPDNMMAIVQGARLGWDLADQALRQLIREHLDRHQEMGTYLTAYAMDVSSGWKPKYISGPKKAEFVLRNLVIAFLVKEVAQKFGVNEFRNEASSRPCGCSVVARAWREERHDKKMTEAAVVTIVTIIKQGFHPLSSNT